MKQFNRKHLSDVPLKEIDIGNRFRDDYGDLDALAESFDIAGMMHDLGIREHSNPDSAFKYELIYGGRRYWALALNKQKTANAYLYYDLSDEDLRLMERIENAQRKQTTWQEDARLDAEIHKLQQERHGAPTPRQPAKEGDWTQQDTADFVGKSRATVSENIKLAQALEAHPELEQCTKASQARSMLKSIERNAKAEKIAKSRLEQEKSSTRASILEPNFIVGDAIAGLKGLKAEVADLVEIDPPYGIAYADRDHSKANTHAYTDVAEEDYAKFAKDMLTEAYRIAKPGGWCVFWHDIGKTQDLRTMMEEIGWKMCKIPLVWNKIIGGGLTNPNLHLSHTYEIAYYAYKGGAKIVKTGQPDVFSAMSVRDQYRIHPTERPLDLMIQILKTFAEPGATVISPFLGSGVTLYAAYECGMNCFGWDLEQSNKDKFVVKCENWRGYNRKELEDDSTTNPTTNDTNGATVAEGT